MKSLNSNSTSKFVGLLLPLGSLITLVLFAFLPSGSALAATPKCGLKDVNCIITIGDQEIAARITALNTLNGKVVALQKANQINADQANAIESDITTNENGLTALKKQLDVETNAKAARADVQAIVYSFRIFLVVLPRDYHQLHLAVEIVVSNKLAQHLPDIQQAVKQAPAGKQHTLNPLLNDYQAQLTQAQAQISTAKLLLPDLTVDNFNHNFATYKSDLKQLETAEQDAHSDLHNAAKDLHTIAQDLK